MRIKVCGLRQAENIAALGALPLDLVGFIFYPKSSRFVATKPLIQLPPTVKRVGVFVNASIDEIEEKASQFALDYIQLHGDESPAFCQCLVERGYVLLKAFGVGQVFDWKQLSAYEGLCRFFLLDTKGASYGGNGVTFNWDILQDYPSKTPFLLSGGIAPDSVSALKALDIPQLYGIDINSRFEEAPGFKNVDLVHQFIQQLQSF
ncbi:MAG: phosphoribosylanthranilate isomerase [Aureispira sp.]